MNRKSLIVGISIFVVLVIVVIAGAGLLISRLKTQLQPQQRVLISELVYCNSHNIKPCIVSFSVSADGSMLVNLITPSASYPGFYLTISNSEVANRYECQQVEDFPTNIYCTGPEMYPGEALQFNIIAIKDETILAEGNFAIIGLLLPNPAAETTEAPLATGTFEPTKSPTPFLLELPTPFPTGRNTTIPTPVIITPSYPNPSYPYP